MTSPLVPFLVLAMQMWRYPLSEVLLALLSAGGSSLAAIIGCHTCRAVLFVFVAWTSWGGVLPHSEQIEEHNYDEVSYGIQVWGPSVVDR